MNQNVKITRQQAEEEAKMLEKVFDVVRFLEGDFFEQMQDDPRIGVKIGMCQCYDFWKKNKPCENCTSMKAYAEKKQKTKLEFLDADVFLVISRYLEIDDEACVMELVKHLENDTLIDTDGRDKLVGKLKGYQDKLYIDPVTGVYNRRYFEDEIVPEATLNDIDENLINEYKIIMDISDLSTEDVLKARNFYIDGKITNAGILLFGKSPSKFLPQARLRVIKYDGDKQKVGTEINIVKEKNFDSAIPNIIRNAREFINTQLREFQYLDKDGKFRIMPVYPEFAWFEGIVNALTHRNYSMRGEHIKVLIYDDRMEILSPGLLPNIVTIENILNQRYSRNPRIARILSEFGWVKEMNEGVKRIYSEMEKLFLNEPRYYEPNNNVLLVLENNILNRSLRSLDHIKNNISKIEFDKLTISEKRILYYMYNSGINLTTKDASQYLGKGITYCKKILKELEKKKLIKWYGSSIHDRTQYYKINF